MDSTFGQLVICSFDDPARQPLIATGKKKPAAKRQAVKSEKPVDGTPKLEALLKDGQLTAPFKQCLVEIFSRFDVDKDKLLSEEELKAFSRAANKDGHEFTAQELSEMKSMFEWLDGPNGPKSSGLSLRGFVQMYTQQTMVSELESWSDLSKLGYDAFLKRREEGSDSVDDSIRPEEVSAILEEFSKSSDEFVSFPTSPAAICRVICQTASSLGFECRILQQNGSERLSVFKMAKMPEASSPTSPQAGASHVSSPTSEPEKSGGVPVFSALELDSKSCRLLQNEFGDEIPSGWTIYAHHMTICLGSLTEARSNGILYQTICSRPFAS